MSEQKKLQYPSLKEVEEANYEEIYRWFLLLPFPRRVKTGKGKTTLYVVDPPGGTELMQAIYKRWVEFGGRDREMANKILKEGVVEKAKG